VAPPLVAQPLDELFLLKIKYTAVVINILTNSQSSIAQLYGMARQLLQNK